MSVWSSEKVQYVQPNGCTSTKFLTKVQLKKNLIRKLENFGNFLNVFFFNFYFFLLVSRMRAILLKKDSGDCSVAMPQHVPQSLPIIFNAYLNANSFTISPYLFRPYHPHKQDRFLRVHTKDHDLLLIYKDTNSKCNRLLLLVLSFKLETTPWTGLLEVS